jgi:hypothetical protein
MCVVTGMLTVMDQLQPAGLVPMLEVTYLVHEILILSNWVIEIIAIIIKLFALGCNNWLGSLIRQF